MEAKKWWPRLVAQAWADPKFKQRLLADPAAVLKENGVTMPAGVAVKVVENTSQVVYLTLPAQRDGELSDAELEQVAGGIIAILIGRAPPTEPNIKDGTLNT